MKRCLLCASSFILISCVSPLSDSGGVAADIWPAGDKSDAAGLAEGSAEALGVLKLANEATLEELDARVHLSNRTAANIVAYRLGDDGVEGTDDDGFATVDELLEVPGIGPIAFRKLRDYATANGYVDGGTADNGMEKMFAVDTTRPAMSQADLLEFFPPGETEVSVGTFSVTGRSRDQCTSLTGCTPWIYPTEVTLMHKTFDPTTGDHTPTHHVLPASGEVVLRIDPIDDDVDIHFVATEPETGNLLKTRCDDTRGRMACGSVIDFPDDPTGLAVLDFADYHPQYGVLLGNQVLVLWRGRVYDDGTFHFVTTLIGPPDTSIDAAANRNQLAITGKLPE